MGMSSQVASAIIGEASSLAGTTISGLYNNYANRQQFKRTKELMQMQNQMNIDNWNMENAYNDPSAEIQRLRKAGLNPDLIYGSGAGNLQGASVNSAGLGSAPSNYDLPTDLGSSVLQGISVGSQIEVNKALADKYRAESNKTNTETPWISKIMQSQLGLNDANTKVINESVEKVRSETDLLKIQKDLYSRQNEMEKVLYEKNVEARLAELGASAEQSKVIISEFCKYYTAQINVALSTAYKNYKEGTSAEQNALSNRISANASMYNAHTNRYVAKSDFSLKQSSLELNKARVSFEKAVADADIRDKNARAAINELSNNWRDDLNNAGVIGRAIANFVDMPGAVLGGILK